MLQVWDLRKVLISYYIKSIIYYTVRSPKLHEWLENPAIAEAVKSTTERNFADLDPIFNSNIDEDFDFRSSGITRHSFCSVYLTWIQHCCQARDPALPCSRDSQVLPDSQPEVVSCFFFRLFPFAFHFLSLAVVLLEPPATIPSQVSSSSSSGSTHSSRETSGSPAPEMSGCSPTWSFCAKWLPRL